MCAEMKAHRVADESSPRSPLSVSARGGASVCGPPAQHLVKYSLSVYDGSFRHKSLEALYGRGTKAGIQPRHAVKLRLQLTALDAATKPSDLAAPGWRLHPLTGDLKGFHSITVNANWRVIFRFVDKDVGLVDYMDYH